MDHEAFVKFMTELSEIRDDDGDKDFGPTAFLFMYRHYLCRYRRSFISEDWDKYHEVDEFVDLFDNTKIQVQAAKLS